MGDGENTDTDQMVMTKSGPPRRTLEEIMQGSPDDSNDEMDSQDSAREKDRLMEEHIKFLNQNN